MISAGALGRVGQRQSAAAGFAIWGKPAGASLLLGTIAIEAENGLRIPQDA